MGGSAASNNTLKSGETLSGANKLISANGQFMLRMQDDDGHLCVYRVENGQQGGFVWGSGKYGFRGGKLVMQGDGNLVVQDASNNAQWSSGTHPYFDAKFKDANNKPVKLVLENDGKLKLYNAGGSVVWSNQ